MPARPEFVASMREHVVGTARKWDARLPEDIADVLELLTSELVTNVCQHAGGTMTVTVTRSRHRVLVSVEDSSPDMPKVLEAGEDQECWRGLLLVKQLAKTWGACPTRDGKRVWFTVAVPFSPTVRCAATRTDPGWSAVRPLTPQQAVCSRDRRQVAHS